MRLIFGLAPLTFILGAASYEEYARGERYPPARAAVGGVPHAVAGAAHAIPQKVQNIRANGQGVRPEVHKVADAAKSRFKDFTQTKEMQQLLPSNRKFNVMQDTVIFHGPQPTDIFIGRPKGLGPSGKKMYMIKRWWSELNPKTLQCRAHSHVLEPQEWAKLKPRGRTPKNSDWVKLIASTILTREPFTKMFKWKTHKAQAEACRNLFPTIFVDALRPEFF